MIKTLTISPGVTLRCFQDRRFKQGRLSLQFLRIMDRQEAALNSLLPSVLLRGSRNYPDLQAITVRLDDLYGASIGDLVRRIGDLQTTGLYCSFTDDRFALEGDRILEPLLAFLRELLLEPVLEDGCFCADYVESEKVNLITALEAERNDKQVYADSRLLRTMCQADPFGIPRLGDKEQVRKITPKMLYDHYQRVLRESPVELFYVGAQEPEDMAQLLQPLFAGLSRQVQPIPAQTPFRDGGPQHNREQMDISQSRLCMGFVTDITSRDPEYPAMQVLNAVFGGGMTSKLFIQVREKRSLCYSIGSGYYGSKGIVTVSAGIDREKENITREQILEQLEACKTGNITDEELNAAKESLLSGLRTVHDSPGAIESYYASAALSAMPISLPQYREAVSQLTVADVAKAAQRLQLHSEFFLEGVSQ